MISPTHRILSSPKIEAMQLHSSAIVVYKCMFSR